MAKSKLNQWWNSSYINTSPNNIAVGALWANQWPFNTTVQDMFDKILYQFTQQTNVLTISWAQIFEKWAEQQPRTLTNTTTRSTNPTYAITSTVFKRWATVLDTQAGDTTPRTYSETTSIVDTTTFSAEVTNSNGYTSTSTKTLTAVYPIFYGRADCSTPPARNQQLIDDWSKLVASSTGTITLNFGATDQYIWFAIPASSTSKTKRYVNALNNGDIGSPSDLFDAEELVDISSPNVYRAGVQYKIYVSTYKTTTTGNMELRNS